MTNPTGAVGVIDSEDYFWQQDKHGRWFRLGASGIDFASLKDLEEARGEVTPLFAGNNDLAEARLTELHKAQAEILKLETLYGAKIEGHACECDEITPGNHISPPEYEQNPWCPVHPSVSQIRADLKAVFSDRIALRQMIFDMAKADDDRPLTPGEIEVSKLLTGSDDETDPRNREITRLKDLLEKATDLIEGQRATGVLEQQYTQSWMDTMEKRRAYEKALAEHKEGKR